MQRFIGRHASRLSTLPPDQPEGSASRVMLCLARCPPGPAKNTVAGRTSSRSHSGTPRLTMRRGPGEADRQRRLRRRLGAVNGEMIISRPPQGKANERTRLASAPNSSAAAATAALARGLETEVGERAERTAATPRAGRRSGCTGERRGAELPASSLTMRWASWGRRHWRGRPSPLSPREMAAASSPGRGPRDGQRHVADALTLVSCRTPPLAGRAENRTGHRIPAPSSVSAAPPPTGPAASKVRPPASTCSRRQQRRSPYGQRRFARIR